MLHMPVKQGIIPLSWYVGDSWGDIVLQVNNVILRFALDRFTVKILNIGTCMSEQTV